MKSSTKIYFLFNLLFLTSSCNTQTHVTGKSNKDVNVAIASASVQEPNDTAYVGYWWGQSNVAGRAAASGLSGSLAYLNTKMVNGDDTVFIRSWQSVNEGRLGVFETGINNGDDTASKSYGSNVKFAYDWLQWSGKDFYMFQAGQGGQNIVQWTQSVRNLYKYCDTGTSAMQAEINATGRPIKVLFAVWIQGESNGGKDTTKYKALLDSVKHLTRIRSGNPTLPFFEIQMADCQKGVPALAELQLAQQTWAWTNVDDHVYFFPKDSGDGCQDVLHFNGLKQRKLSDQMLAKVQELYPWLAK